MEEVTSDQLKLARAEEFAKLKSEVSQNEAAASHIERASQKQPQIQNVEKQITTPITTEREHLANLYAAREKINDLEEGFRDHRHALRVTHESKRPEISKPSKPRRVAQRRVLSMSKIHHPFPPTSQKT